MSFTSIRFYAWLAAAVVVYRAVPARLRPVTLVLLSAAYCGAASPVALALLLGITAVAYIAGLRLTDQQASEAKRSAVMYVAIALLVGPLVVFKVAGASNGVLIPLGLSYYTFKLTSYVLETYWDPEYVQRSPVRLAAYAAFGAQLLSGPIQRPASFFEQLEAVRTEPQRDENFEKAFRLILYGLILKLVVGDRLGAFTALVTQSPDAYARPVLAATAFTYLPQLYADFAGYTNIALGIGLLFGIEGPPNFDAPFSASNLQEYWRRWHMSLTSWLGDYVFTPLRMTMRAWGKVGLASSVIINMTLIGVWHGFTLCYLAFGVLQGIFLAVSVLTLKRREKVLGRISWLTPVRTVVGIIVVQVLLAAGQIFFQANTIQGAWVLLRNLVGLHPAGPKTFAEIRTDVVAPLLVCWLCAFYAGLGLPGTRRVRDWAARIPNWARYGFCLFVIAALTLEEGGKFIYGQF